VFDRALGISRDLLHLPSRMYKLCALLGGCTPTVYLEIDLHEVASSLYVSDRTLAHIGSSFFASADEAHVRLKLSQSNEITLVMLASRQIRSYTGFAAAFSAAAHRLCDIQRICTACRCSDAAGPLVTSGFSTAAARHQADPTPAADAADGGGAFTSLHDAARSPAAVRRLDLTTSPQLRCSNLLCDKVGEPCICRISRCAIRQCICIFQGPWLMGPGHGRLACATATFAASACHSKRPLSRHACVPHAIDAAQPSTCAVAIIFYADAGRGQHSAWNPCRVFEQLEGVQELVLRGNALTELPATTWQLTLLRHLDLSDNQLATLPPDIAQLQQLQARRSLLPNWISCCTRERILHTAHAEQTC
jgi:Leucine rich repeat